jgi:4-amino-4-deoxy-L-arabinose transferase-like glycosyltransferase
MTAALANISKRNALVGILAVALVLRLIAAFVLPDQSALLSDAVAYRTAGAQIATHWHMTNAYQMPLYPLLIAIAGSWQVAADIAVSVVSVWLVYALAEELFDARWAAPLAGLAAAFYPPLIFFSVVGLSETLFIALVLAAFLFWYRGAFAAAAVFAVLAILTRPIFDIAAPCLVVFFALVIHRLSFVQAARHLVVYAAIYCALMTPWWLNTYAEFGRFVRLTNGFGIQLYAGNNPLNKSGGSNEEVDFSSAPFASIADPVERDRAMRDAAIAYIRDNPGRFAEMSALKFIRMWRLWPANEGYSNPLTVIISVASFVPVLLLSAYGIFAARAGIVQLSPILLFALGYTAIIMVMAGTIRYRLPLEPFMLVFAAAGASRLFGNTVSVRGQAANKQGVAYARVGV